VRSIQLKQFAPFRLDSANECLWRGDERIALQPKPFAVLRYLVENPGRLITHDELLDALWPETYVQPQVLRTYMLELRKILGDDAAEPRFIETMPKRGYRFVAAVTEAEASASAAGRGWVAPVAMAGEAAGEIVGREEEVGRLQAELERLAAGQRRMVMVSGEVGIGKTALVDAFSRAACAASGMMAARGQCVPGVGRTEEYYPVMEALRHLCTAPEGETARRTLKRMAPAWLAMLGLEASGAEVPARERMPGSLCAALEEISATRPLILIFEDLQWADSATLNLIAALARRRAGAKLMVLATFRTRGVATGHPLKTLKQELLMQRLCIEIALGPLDAAAMMKLLRRELGTESVQQQLGNFIYVHAEGNPLFAIVLLRHLIAQKFLVWKGKNGEGEWKLTADLEGVDAGVPDELAQMVELEIERLTAKEQSLLEAGSLMNIAFPAWAVAAALGTDAAETEEACDALAQKIYFVQHAGQDELPNGARSAFYAFTHGLYREVLYQRQSAARRAQRHIRVAERLGELFAGREAHVAREMALHFDAAESWQRGARARRDAARYARERQAHAEAAELLEKALGRAEHLSQAEVEEIRGELEQARQAMKKTSKAGRKVPLKL